jgi:hypothetical protein
MVELMVFQTLFILSIESESRSLHSLNVIGKFLPTTGSISEMIEDAEEALLDLAEREQRSNSYYSNAQ